LSPKPHPGFGLGVVVGLAAKAGCTENDVAAKSATIAKSLKKDVLIVYHLLSCIINSSEIFHNKNSLSIN